MFFSGHLDGWLNELDEGCVVNPKIWMDQLPIGWESITILKKSETKYWLLYMYIYSQTFLCIAQASV